MKIEDKNDHVLDTVAKILSDFELHQEEIPQEDHATIREKVEELYSEVEDLVGTKEEEELDPDAGVDYNQNHECNL